MADDNLLIDTQSFIWFVENNPRLPDSFRKVMENDKNNLFISIASLWEIVIKSSIGKLNLRWDVPEIINGVNKNGFAILHIMPQHLITLHRLEYFHRDPFDRIIISQGITENMQIVSSDEAFKNYQVKLINT